MKVEERVVGINAIGNKLLDCGEEEVKELVEIRALACKNMWRHLYIKNNMLIQKTGMRWVKEGDTNSKNFHNIVKGRARRKSIGSIDTKKGKVE